jgi:hypothetical protein
MKGGRSGGGSRQARVRGQSGGQLRTPPSNPVGLAAVDALPFSFATRGLTSAGRLFRALAAQPRAAAVARTALLRLEQAVAGSAPPPPSLVGEGAWFAACSAVERRHVRGRWCRHERSRRGEHEHARRWRGADVKNARRGGMSRRRFLHGVGYAGGGAAAYEAMVAMGLLAVPPVYAGAPGARTTRAALGQRPAGGGPRRRHRGAGLGVRASQGGGVRRHGARGEVASRGARLHRARGLGN